MSKVVITGDTTIDLSPELMDKYSVKCSPLYVTLGDKSYKDGFEISPDEIYTYVNSTGTLPKTSAVTIEDYIEFFKAIKQDCDEIVHFDISSDMSCTYQNACIAAKEVGNVYCVDSRNLSTGTGLLVLYACDLAKKGMSAKEIYDIVTKKTDNVKASFIIKRLDYLSKGGRCSSLTALGANILSLRPVIVVKDGKMGVDKKFRGDYKTCVVKYIESALADRDDIDYSCIFITHTKCDKEVIDAAYEAVRNNGKFEEIIETLAGCTVTTHCGENTLGVLFMTK